MRFVPVLAALFLTVGCTATYPVVGSFDKYNEVFIGEVNADLMAGRSVIEIEAKNSGMRCIGGSRVTFIPASNYAAGLFLIPYCGGQKGIAELSCDDGRRISATWTADSCTSGYGTGYDDDGARFQFAFGMSESAALARFEKDAVAVADRPEFPVYRPKEARREKGFATGTGFLVSTNGHIVTNFHVVEDATEVFIWHGGRKYPADVIRRDSSNDVAVLKTELTGQPILIDPGMEYVVAEEIMALGYPLIQDQGQALKATFGRINAASGPKDDPRFLQIDVPIQAGNSGGPVVNERGELVGIATMTYGTIVTLIETGTLPQNVNYAVKLDYVLPLIKNLRGAVPRHKAVGFKALVPVYKDSVFLVVAK